MQNRVYVLGALALAILVIAGAWYSRPHEAPNTDTPSTSSSPEPASSAPATSTNSGLASTKPTTLPISSKDTIVSWSFKGSHKDGGAMEQKATSRIAALKSQIDESNPEVQITYIGIGEQYELLGDGKNAYDYYLKALNSSQRYQQPDALAWGGLADLLATLGAPNTAAVAYGNAVKSLPGEPSFHVARISFLMSHFAKDTALINAAFTEADKDVPGDKSIAQLKEQFKKSEL